uniref:Uncharacterized protein n=1 Tax=uncultured marine group II/III euryarchaeote KM3_192_C12 TaxID=1457964 RepID=A0A075GW07_9EURY|nr:hypothetical protein [uncultured marine group II/III euryarchaeote KM3_192_C12]
MIPHEWLVPQSLNSSGSRSQQLLCREIIDILAANHLVMMEDGAEGGESSVLVGIPTKAPPVEEPVPKASLMSAYWGYKTSTTLELTRLMLTIVLLVFTAILFLLPEGRIAVLEPYENAILQLKWGVCLSLPLVPFVIYWDITGGAKKWRAENED